MALLNQEQRPWLLPLFCLMLLAPLTPWLDIELATFFYRSGAGTINHFVKHPILEFIYDYGTLPGLITASLGMVGFAISYSKRSLRSWRRPAMLLLLVMAIGSGFFTNSLLKEYWGRPRPTQIEAFGGQQSFHPFYQPRFFAQPEPSRSFPCGHSSSGFYFFALAFVARRLKIKWLEISGFSLALLLGTLLGVTRMAQGGHFFSDVIVSGLVMWWTTLLFDWLLYVHVEERALESIPEALAK